MRSLKNISLSLTVNRLNSLILKAIGKGTVRLAVVFCLFILLPKLNFSASNPDLGNNSVNELEAELSIPASVWQQAVQIQFFTATTKAKFEDKLSVFEIEENEDSLSGKKQVLYGAFLLLLFTVIANDLLLRDVFIAVNNRSNSLFTGKSHFISICSLRI